MTEKPRQPNSAPRDPFAPPPELEIVADGHDLRRRSTPLSFILTMDALRTVARVASLVIVDAVGIYLAILVALEGKSLLFDGVGFSANATQAYNYAVFAVLLTLLLFARAGLYGDRGSRPGLGAVVSALFSVALVALVYSLIVGRDFSSYYIFWGTLIFAVLIVGSLRALYDRASGRLLRAAGYRRSALLVGVGSHAEAVGAALSSSRANPIEIVGIVGPAELDEAFDEQHFEELVIADPGFSEQRVLEIVDRCHERGVRVRVAPSTSELLARRAEFVPGSAVPLFELRAPVFDGADYALKRFFDLTGAALSLLILSPLLLMIALAVAFTSRGPVLFRSRRPGIAGMPFDCLKFRTMYEGAEMRQQELEAENEADGPLFKIRRDPRITPVGRLLRRFSLDELPQLWNVLRGEMSIIGPRPLPQRDYARLEDWHRRRYLVLPGMTGLWQVSGRSELDFDDLVNLDFLYIERWSLALDLSIIVQTIPAVLRRRGAF
jgi:exopolysaccharide biosynthesis polyprenyl glycosylphosphotransferase